MGSELEPIPHDKVTPGWWWAYHFEESQDDAVAGKVWGADIYGDEVLHFTGPEDEGMVNQVVDVQAKILAPIPSVELCRFLHDAGITTVEQLEAWRHGK